MNKNELYLLIDTSRSMLRPGSLSALQEIIEKIYSDLLSDPIEKFFTDLRVYQCSDNQTKYMGKNQWLPTEADCKGIAPIADALCDTILPELRKSSTVKKLLVVISDGYWCGPHSKVIDFEFACFSEKLSAIAEINIMNYCSWNLTQSSSVKLFSTDDSVTKQLIEAVKKI